MKILFKIISLLKRHKKLTLIVALLCNVILYYFNIYIGVVCTIIGLISLSSLVVFKILNKALKKTNWWKNNTALAKQFISNEGYRENLQRNYEIVNVGSNPARFAFFYEDVRGQNWSTGTQGLDMDLEILRFYHSFMKPGATVILPIVAFSSVSGYLNRFPVDRHYLAKFASILDWLQIAHHPQLKTVNRYLRYPLFYNIKALRYLIKDVTPDNRLNIVEQPMQTIEMEEDARRWIENCWKPEFNIKKLNDPLTQELREGRKISVRMMSNMIRFLTERGYRPVIVSPPMSSALCTYFTPQVHETYITSFAQEFENMGVPFLDYTHDERFTKHEYFFNALFMNLKGRKAFTRQVLQDLGLINNKDCM